MKILFRPHRSSLKESLLERKEFNTYEELLEYLSEYYSSVFDLEYDDKYIPSDFIVSYYCFDERIDWNTYIVSIRMKKDYFPIGFLTFMY